jgi:hypothetical protein
MSLRQLVTEVQPAPATRNPHHHVHGGRTRRDFLRDVGVGGAGLVVGGTLLGASPASARAGGQPEGTARPQPIPVGQPEVAPFRVFLPSPPGEGHEPSVITDFKGDIGLCQVQGTGTDDGGTTWFFDADMRFMQGDYLTVEGNRRHGTFGFI